jgi:hypothetical protein
VNLSRVGDRGIYRGIDTGEHRERVRGSGEVVRLDFVLLV